MDPRAGGGEHAPQRGLRIGAWRGVAEDLEGLLHRHAAGDLTAVEPAHTIGQQRDAALFLADERILRFPKVEVVLVDFADRSGGGEAGVAQAHGVGKTRAPLPGRASGAVVE